MEWIQFIGKDIIMLLIAAWIGASLALYRYKREVKWNEQFNKINEALVKLEELKFISLHQSRDDPECTMIPLSKKKSSASYLNDLILDTIESLVPLKILFNKELGPIIQSFEGKVTIHYDKTYWDYHNRLHFSDEWDNYRENLEITLNHSKRIHRTASALSKLILKKSKNLA